jgi:hypothetical protein
MKKPEVRPLKLLTQIWPILREDFNGRSLLIELIKCIFLKYFPVSGGKSESPVHGIIRVSYFFTYLTVCPVQYVVKSTIPVMNLEQKRVQHAIFRLVFRKPLHVNLAYKVVVEKPEHCIFLAN